jgi:hypothetical protein
MNKNAFAFLLLLSAQIFAADNDKDFKPLFNGRDLSGWVYQGKVRKNNSWGVENGILKNDLRPGKSGSELLTEGKFWNFTIRFDFMVPEGSNSGIYLRGRHEIQLTGDYSNRKLGAAGNGAIWNVKAPDAYASKSSGDWQTMEATIIGHHITVLLNNVKIHDNVFCDKPTGGALDSHVNEAGPLMLQGTLGPIKFRNIRIKELPR